MLTTYRGSKRVLAGEDLTPGNPGNNGPIAWDEKYVRNGIYFTDTFGVRRLVTHVGDSIYSVNGNDVEQIFKYPDNVDTDAGRHSVEFIEHQNHVIILNPGFPPLKWGGDEAVSWLGIRDIPVQPEIHVARTFGKYFENIKSWGIGTAGYRPPVFMQHDDAVDPAKRAWKYKLAFMNSRGQIGRYGAESYFELHPTGGDQLKRQHPIVEWKRPVDQGPDFELPAATGHPTGNGTDITHIVLARTGDTIADANAGAFFVHDIYPFTMNHITDGKPDAALSLAIEEDNFPPVSAAFGAVYRDTLMISGNREDPNGVWWSKPGFMEAFPPINYYKATSPVTAIIPLSDRVAIVTRNTVEVLRQDSTGIFGQFRVEWTKGTQFGRSLVEYKGSLFGIFDSGFGIFDGFAYKGMADEFGELFDFITEANADRIRAHADSMNRYWITINYADIADKSGLGLVLMYDFSLNAWFRIDDVVTSFFEEDGELFFGGKDNFRAFNHGTGGNEHILEIAPTFMEDKNAQYALIHKEINDFWVRIASSGEYTGRVKFFVDEQLAEEDTTGSFPCNLSRPGLAFSGVDSVWDDAVFGDAQWDAPRFGWQKADMSDPVEFYSIRIQIIIPAQAYAEISGVAMDLSIENVQTAR